jgi:hypothetical protein
MSKKRLILCVALAVGVTGAWIPGCTRDEMSDLTLSGGGM